MAKAAFEKKVEAVEALRSAGDPVQALRKALKDRSNYLTARAAVVAADLRRLELIPDLVAAFDRFLTDPVKTDPQCWAKTAIAKALKELGYRGPEVFLRGIGHIQMEPVWGGEADSAGTLRGTCTLALVDSPLDDVEVLTHVVERLADTEAPVRVDAALAIAQLARPEGALLLRLKLLTGDKEPQVLGQCFASLLSLEGSRALAFIERFLEDQSEELRVEAASVLAQSREPEALEILKRYWKRRVPAEVRHAILISLGASPLPESAEFLLSVIKTGPADLATQALQSLAASRFRANAQERVKAVVEERDEAALTRALAETSPFKP